MARAKSVKSKPVTKPVQVGEVSEIIVKHKSPCDNCELKNRKVCGTCEENNRS